MKIFNNKNIIQKIPEVEEPMQYNEQIRSDMNDIWFKHAPKLTRNT